MVLRTICDGQIVDQTAQTNLSERFKVVQLVLYSIRDITTVDQFIQSHSTCFLDIGFNIDLSLLCSPMIDQVSWSDMLNNWILLNRFDRGTPDWSTF